MYALISDRSVMLIKKRDGEGLWYGLVLFKSVLLSSSLGTLLSVCMLVYVCMMYV